jgi:signal transduction histidine kinase
LLNKLKEQVIFIIDFDSLNNHLKKYVSNEFNLNYIKINLNINKWWQVFKFLDSKSKNDIFINDVVFLSENKYNFDLNLLDKEINKDAYLILPLKDKWKNIIWYFEIWKKPFWEHYYTDEILIIKDLASFLSLHLMYINMYSEINYLTINLDKEVDKKTIEYNNLINKLKEFISISSHEIKTPIMSISLQIESIIDDINNSNNDINNIKLELDTLKNQIYNISDLVKVLFNIEKYDIWKVWLYLEKVNLDNIFSNEINNLKLINPKLQINYNFNSDIYYIDLDKVQFTQVISNLLHNAVKFCNKVNPVINVTIKSFENNIKLEIEDNWNWFKNNEEDFIFEKYSTWFWKSIWLWLWLYLCKKIIDLHNWTIKALNSKKLWWALISIIIPKNQKKEK